MSDQHDDRMSESSPRQVAGLADEMRDLEMPDLDFDRIEKGLMARVDAESRRRRVRARGVTAVAALALAAAAVLVAGRTPSLSGEGAPRGDQTMPSTASHDIGAGSIESGVMTSSGHTLAQGETLHRGDLVEATHAIVRAPGRVVYSVEGSMTVSETDRPIVLSLASGAVEAQVDKVPSGEAFAVDLVDHGGSGNDVVRIAVHGTHLRVAREGKHVVLDLTEGIVNVGHPPKTGSTYGTLVTAPAHVELDIDALETSFTMTKDPARIRAAADLSPSEQISIANAPQKVAPAQEPVHVVDPRVDPHAPKPLVIAPAVAQQTQPQAPAPVATVESAPVDPKTAILDAIAKCEREKVAARPNGTLTIMSQLNLRVGDDGKVQAARFEPPLEQSVQDCASTTIYKVRFAQPGNVLIDVSVER
jgi:hypothetical protein